MKTVSGVLGGGAIVGLWRKLPGAVKYPLLFGLGAITAAELNSEINQSWVSGRIFGGQAAEADAKSADPTITHADLEAGRPVTNAGALLATQVGTQDADMRKKGIEAFTANESTSDILLKKQRGEKLTTTEELQLLEVQTKAQELATKAAQTRQAKAEAKIKEAESTAAKTKAEADIVTNNYVKCMLGDTNGRKPAAGDLMAKTLSGECSNF